MGYRGRGHWCGWLVKLIYVGALGAAGVLWVMVLFSQSVFWPTVVLAIVHLATLYFGLAIKCCCPLALFCVGLNANDVGYGGYPYGGYRWWIAIGTDLDLAALTITAFVIRFGWGDDATRALDIVIVTLLVVFAMSCVLCFTKTPQGDGEADWELDIEELVPGQHVPILLSRSFNTKFRY